MNTGKRHTPSDTKRCENMLDISTDRDIEKERERERERDRETLDGHQVPYTDNIFGFHDPL